MRLLKFAAVAFLLVAIYSLRAASVPNEHRKAQHVVVIVWDGMRPDFVNAKDCPTLAALARDGVFFANNHSSYPTSTNVNGAVLATGDYPGHSGLISNQEFRPAIDPLKHFDTADFPGLDAVDQQINVQYLSAPTVAETVQKAGYRTAIAGSKPVAQLADRSRQRESDIATKSIVVYRGKVLPKTAAATITAAIGPFPSRKDNHLPNSDEDAWTTRALTEVLWKDDVPKFSLLWLSEPDLSQHQTAPGSPTSLAAIKSDDQDLAKVLAALRAKNALTTTDVFVVSDHGFSTIDLAVDAAQRLRAAGFDAVRFFTSEPKEGQVMVVSLGGSIEFYVIGHEPAVTHRLVDYLQHSDFAGVILTREKMDGTFTLRQLAVASKDAPDVIVSCRWDDRPNKYKTKGEVASDIGKSLGQGTHSTLSSHDLHNTLIASGPDFRRGWRDETATGNIDVAPTALWLLGLQPLQPMDGRVLREALVASPNEAPAARSDVLTARRMLDHGSWEQSVRLTKVAGVTYFLQGNGGVEGKDN